MSDASLFNEDHHFIKFYLDKDDIIVSDVYCPYEDDPNSLCRVGRGYCVVRRFIGVYGTQICIGECEIMGPMEIAWFGTQTGESSDLDNQFSGMWFVPIEDADYQRSKLELA